MKKTIGSVTLGLFCMTAIGWGQSPATTPAPAALKFLSSTWCCWRSVLRSASTFHDLVKNLNVEEELESGPQRCAP